MGVVERPEGKKNWVVVDERDHAHTLHPRQITFTASDQLYRAADIAAFLKSVEAFLDPSSLEIAWEILIEEGGRSVEPKELAQLLFSEQSAPCCYAAHRLLSEDKLYFKQKGDLYEPRTAAASGRAKASN